MCVALRWGTAVAVSGAVVREKGVQLYKRSAVSRAWRQAASMLVKAVLKTEVKEPSIEGSPCPW